MKNCARPSTPVRGGPTFHFGIDREGTAAELEKLAAAIRSGDAIVESTRLIDRASQEDFLHHTLILRFCVQR